MNNSSEKLLKPKLTKSARKKMASIKRLQRKRNKSLQNILTKIRNSHASESNDSCITINNSRSIQDLTDGDTVLFIEDKHGDDNIGGNENPRHDTAMRQVDNCIESKQARNRTHMLSKYDRFSPQRKKSKMVAQSSTPISKNVSLNISNVSEVSKVKSPKRNKGLERQIRELQKELTQSSYVTIDLTNGSESRSVIDLTSTNELTVVSKVTDVNNLTDVIDVDRSEGECTASVSNITVIEKKKEKLNEKEIVEGIAQLNSSEKGRLLEMITNRIFNGCQMTPKKQSKKSFSAEDTYIREMISGGTRESVGENVYNPCREHVRRSGLRMVVIDGSNVAMQHGKKGLFSVRGLKICIDYFLKRGHTVKAFVPQYRCHAGKSTDPQLLNYLEKRGLVVFTPSRRLDDGRCYSSYDDRYIVQCAAEFDGVIVSQDRYRDLVQEKPSWTKTIECRLLQYTWVEDMIMFPVDPLGKDGPTLDTFLRHP